MITTRTVGSVLGFALMAVGLMHCSTPTVGALPDTDNTKTPASHDSNNDDNASSDVTPESTGVKTTSPTKTPAATATPAPKATATATATGGASSTQKSGPGASCTALTTCCGKLSNSLESVGCLLAAGKQNELVCAGALLTFSCTSLTAQTASHGPSCSGLTSGALYCGNDGVGGDSKTLYRCSDSGPAIASQCANGCTINDGIDDACATSAGTTTNAGASCDGLSGDYCGTDFVGGDANTLYTCDGTHAAPKSTQRCANGCNTHSDNTNDTCATSAPASTATGDDLCEGLPDFSYCGSSLGGDANTLYTCSGGALTSSMPCANGCTVGASNVSDYCAFTPGGANDNASCAGLDDGFYCGTNGPMGDASTLYSCTGGQIDFSQPCDLGCFAGDFGGADSCN